MFGDRSEAKGLLAAVSGLIQKNNLIASASNYNYPNYSTLSLSPRATIAGTKVS